MKAWYLVYSKVHQERTALDNLQRQGYESYLPLVVRKASSKRSARASKQALFPRYLFVRLSDQHDNWGPLHSTIGVARLVRFGDEPARVPTDFIDFLKNRENPDGLQALSPVALQPGDRVRIADGPLSGYEAIFEAPTGNEQVNVLLAMSERYVRVQMSADSLDRVE